MEDGDQDPNAQTAQQVDEKERGVAVRDQKREPFGSVIGPYL